MSTFERQRARADLVAIACWWVALACGRARSVESSSDASTAMPDTLGARNVADIDAFAVEDRGSVRAISNELLRRGEGPSEFFAAIERGAHATQVHLRHASSFSPENREVLGNPGGRCATVELDAATRVVRVRAWQ